MKAVRIKPATSPTTRGGTRRLPNLPASAGKIQLFTSSDQLCRGATKNKKSCSFSIYSHGWMNQADAQVSSRCEVAPHCVRWVLCSVGGRQSKNQNKKQYKKNQWWKHNPVTKHKLDIGLNYSFFFLYFKTKANFCLAPSFLSSQPSSSSSSSFLHPHLEPSLGYHRF